MCSRSPLRFAAIVCLATVLLNVPAVHGQEIGPLIPASRETPGPYARLFMATGEAARSRLDWRTHVQLSRDASAQAPPPVSRRPPRVVRVRKHSAAYRGAQRVTAGVALGILGFFGGAVAGAAVTGLADSPLQGMAVGAPIGAAGGALLGVWAVR